MGEVYFRISKHLRIGVDEVIRKKFQPQIKFLIFKYTQIILKEQEEYEKLQEQSFNNKSIR